MEMEFLGPPLDLGPLPAVFYFSLSAKDSLHLDPFNQPAKFLPLDKLRVFSLTLPGHHIPPQQALTWWAEQIGQGRDVIEEFCQEAKETIEKFSIQGIITKCALMGLSRGAFIACHLAAKMPLIRTILGFAPLIRLAHAKEFIGMDVERFSLGHLADRICDRTIRFYIGNRDTRVGTSHACHLVSSLAESAHNRSIRSAPIELIIGPSIGRHGHGTSPEIFRAGADWIGENL